MILRYGTTPTGFEAFKNIQAAQETLSYLLHPDLSNRHRPIGYSLQPA